MILHYMVSKIVDMQIFKINPKSDLYFMEIKKEKKSFIHKYTMNIIIDTKKNSIKLTLRIA